MFWGFPEPAGAGGNHPAGNQGRIAQIGQHLFQAVGDAGFFLQRQKPADGERAPVRAQQQPRPPAPGFVDQHLQPLRLEGPAVMAAPMGDALDAQLPRRHGDGLDLLAAPQVESQQRVKQQHLAAEEGKHRPGADHDEQGRQRHPEHGQHPHENVDAPQGVGPVRA